MAFMRHNNNGRRHNNNRHRHQGNNTQQQGQRRHVNRMNHVFESNGPEGRVRGTAQQIVEKYMTMARDAHGAGDKVLSMNYYQHAEHYQRLLNEITEENATFEREREATRAAQQPQPEMTEDGAENTAPDASGDANGSDQPQQQRNRPQRAQQNRNAPRRQTAATENNNDDDLNALPGFLHVPITASAPPPAEQAAPVKNQEAAETTESGVTVVKTRAVRTPRARRVTASSAEESAGTAE